MKIIATSDIHGDLPDPASLPQGDVLVLAGDILPDDYRFKYKSEIGTSRVERQGWWFESVFIPWLADVKHIKPKDKGEKWQRRFKSIILTGGNHDFFLAAMMQRGIQKMLPNNVYYLSESCITLGGVKFFGAGWNCTRGWAFAHDEEDHTNKLAYVPDDVDIMIVHGPPFMNEMDELGIHYTSPILGAYVQTRRNLKAYICGHIHEAYGQYRLGSTPVYVVSRKDRKYQDVNPFVEIEIPSGEIEIDNLELNRKANREFKVIV